MEYSKDVLSLDLPIHSLDTSFMLEVEEDKNNINQLTPNVVSLVTEAVASGSRVLMLSGSSSIRLVESGWYRNISTHVDTRE